MNARLSIDRPIWAGDTTVVYPFSEEKLQDSVGIPPPKIVPKSEAKMGGRKSTQTVDFCALRTFE
jgi:hypothetical protein